MMLKLNPSRTYVYNPGWVAVPYMLFNSYAINPEMDCPLCGYPGTEPTKTYSVLDTHVFRCNLCKTYWNDYSFRNPLLDIIKQIAIEEL